MILNTVEDCFRYRLLRKISSDKEKSARSVEVAIERMKRARQAVGFKLWEYVIMEGYMAMFHISRAVLYKDGIQEKSH